MMRPISRGSTLYQLDITPEFRHSRESGNPTPLLFALKTVAAGAAQNQNRSPNLANQG
jgi:hypothetical protein